MTSRGWKYGLVCLLVLALLLPGFERIEAAAPESMNLEAKMVLDVTHQDPGLPNSHVGGLASNGEFYLYADYYGVLHQSEDGLRWESVPLANSSYKYFTDIAKRLIWDGEQFVLLLRNRLLASKDGREWSNFTPAHPDSAKEYTFTDVVYANGQYVILAQDRDRDATGFFREGENTIFVGKTLSELKEAEKHDFIMSINGERPLDHLTWNGHMYVAGGNGSAYSYDGSLWYGGGAGGYEFNMVWDGTHFWSAHGSRIQSIDANGMDAKLVFEHPENDTNKLYLYSIGSNGRSYIAAGVEGGDAASTSVMYSKDGATWSRIQLGAAVTDIHTILPTPFGYLLAGDRIWYVSEGKINSPSSWAVSDLKQAESNKLVSNALNGFYQANIARQDFSILSVKLYEALTGRWAESPSVNPFRDTVHSFVLKANKLGIINGQEATRFGPGNSITRQDIAVILYRTLRAAGLDVSPAASKWQTHYTDLSQVAPYAEEALRFMNQAGIINGRSADRLEPTGTATREEAISMTARLYERFKGQIETYQGADSIGETLFVPGTPLSSEKVVLQQRAVNLDGRFIWAGDAIKRLGDDFVPLKELAEPLGLRAEWNSNERKLVLAKSETDFATQPDTGLNEHSVVASQPKNDTAEWHDLRYNAGKTDDKISVLVYQNQLYVPLKWLALTFGWQHDMESKVDDRSLSYHALTTEGVKSTYFYWEQNEFKSSWFPPGLEVGERYILRQDGGWQGQAELQIVGDDPSIVTVSRLATGWMLTAVKPGVCEVRITNVDTQEHIYNFLTVN